MMRLLLLLLLLAAPTVADSPPRLEAEAVRLAVDGVRPRLVRLRYLGGDAERVLAASAPVTGLIVDGWMQQGEASWIVTSLYGLESDPTTVIVRLQSGRGQPAEIVARDLTRRLVLLRTAAIDLDLAPLLVGDARVGMRAIAVGRSLTEDAPNLALGIVSAVGRLSVDAIQTDAAISPANYGGPLLSLDGRLLGVITPVAPVGQSGVDWYDSGIGFAMPAADLEPRLRRLAGGVDLRPGRLGVVLRRSAPMWTPAVIESLAQGEAAEIAGLLAGDRIVSVDGVSAPTRWEASRLLKGRDAGQTLRIGVERNGKPLELSVELGESPDPAE